MRMENFDMMVAHNIMELLSTQGKKQTELAKYLNLPRQTVNKILAGKRNLLANELTDIASFFNCKIEDLTAQTHVSDQNMCAFFMGEVSKEKTKEVFKKIFELSDMFVEQQYLNDNKV